MPANKLDSLLAALHLASPALPVGGFAYSQGLEQAVEDRWVTNAAQAFTWISDVMLLSLARQELPLWRLVYQTCSDNELGKQQPSDQSSASAVDASMVVELNQQLTALRETSELKLESMQMGHSMAKLFKQWSQGTQLVEMMPVIEWTYPAAHAALSAITGIDEEMALTAYLWSWLENQVLAAVKIVPLGQIDGQLLLHRLKPVVSQAMSIAKNTSPDELGSAAIGLAVTSTRHETQYSRLFRS